ncbi:MAG: hypothetical protein R3E21_02425 [Caenibius sp.]
MATASGLQASDKNTEARERKFFMVLNITMAAIIVAGFSVNLAMGRSTFAVPAIYHIHAAVFFGWVALYITQSVLIAGNNVALHRRLGILATGWVPVMVVLGITLMIVSMRRTGGPFFFDQNEFLFANGMHLVLFAVLAFFALKVRRYSGWHRRLMVVAMTILTGPGLGRLLPMPLLMPHAWRIMTLAILIFPVAGMIADKRRHGAVHPAWFWGVGAIIVVQVVADLIAYTAWGEAVTHDLLAGYPGGMRPMEAFMPLALAD